MKSVSEHLPVKTANHWARGCPSCKFGIASAPELTGACSLHLERVVQATSKQLKFCTCEAGVRYRVYLLNLRQALIEEARKDPRMQEQARRQTHPDIEVAESLITKSYMMMPAPTMHMAGEPAHA